MENELDDFDFEGEEEISENKAPAAQVINNQGGREFIMPMIRPSDPEAEDKQSARLEMVKLTYRTPTEQLPEMTYLPRHQVANLAFMEMFEAARDPDRKPGNLFTIWRNSMYRHNRSIGGAHLKKAYQLSEAGMLTEDRSNPVDMLDI